MMTEMMPSDEIGLRLHDRATRDEVLNSAEQKQLVAWYAKQDAEEADLLKSEPTVLDLPMLQAQLQKALQQLHQLTTQIQQISLENERLRAENLTLRLQLASQLQPA